MKCPSAVPEAEGPKKDLSSVEKQEPEKLELEEFIIEYSEALTTKEIHP
jgi:hypothetical protein